MTVLPYLSHWFLDFSPSIIVFLKQSYKEAMCPCFLGTGTQALSEWFQASFWPPREQRNQPGEHIFIGSQLNFKNSN